MQSSNLAWAAVVLDIDGVLRDVSGSYRRALADTVEQFTQGAYRPTATDIDVLKGEGIWNNDWEGSQELVYRYFEAQGQPRSQVFLDYDALVAFFQSRYRGPDPQHWTGYICDEPLLVDLDYFQSLTAAKIAWGFFSGATRGSAAYVLSKRIGISDPVLIAMEDAPGKPNPTGLAATVTALAQQQALAAHAPVIYIGDTVADLQTVLKAQSAYPERPWIGVGVLPPHTQKTPEYAAAYAETLRQAGAMIVLSSVRELSRDRIQSLTDEVLKA